MVASEFKIEFNTPVLQKDFTRGVSHSLLEISASCYMNPFTWKPEFLRDVLANHESGKMREKKVHLIVTTLTVGMSNNELEIYLQRFQQRNQAVQEFLVFIKQEGFVGSKPLQFGIELSRSDLEQV